MYMTWAGCMASGPVLVEKDELVFHFKWEGRVYAMTQVLDTLGIYNLDEHRHEIELMDPSSYLRDGYYTRWLFAMESILTRRGILAPGSVDAYVFGSDAPRTTKKPLLKDDLDRVGWGAIGPDCARVPRFEVSQLVRVRNHQPSGHTRLPAYVRDKTGVVTSVNPRSWVYPDTRAHHAGENYQPVYKRAFRSIRTFGATPRNPARQCTSILARTYLDDAASDKGRQVQS